MPRFIFELVNTLGVSPRMKQARKETRAISMPKDTMIVSSMSFIARNEAFKCEHCGRDVGKIVFGGSYRNHCPFCLWSKHVDSDIPGDRANFCQGLMEPIAVQTRRTGEFVLVHRCTKCGFERYNRVAGDDDEKILIALSGLPVK